MITRHIRIGTALILSAFVGLMALSALVRSERNERLLTSQEMEFIYGNQPNPGEDDDNPEYTKDCPGCNVIYEKYSKCLVTSQCRGCKSNQYLEEFQEPEKKCVPYHYEKKEDNYIWDNKGVAWGTSTISGQGSEPGKIPDHLPDRICVRGFVCCQSNPLPDRNCATSCQENGTKWCADCIPTDCEVPTEHVKVMFKRCVDCD